MIIADTKKATEVAYSARGINPLTTMLRGTVRQLVPTDQITNEEWDIKEREYEKMGDGCYAHAAEIRMYRNSRQQTA